MPQMQEIDGRLPVKKNGVWTTLIVEPRVKPEGWKEEKTLILTCGDAMGHLSPLCWQKPATLMCVGSFSSFALIGDVYQREDDSPKEIPGNPWFISTLWLGEYFIVRSENFQEFHKAIPYLEWCVKNALPCGAFAEQVHPTNGSPLSVSPLTWSHSAFVWAVLQYTEEFNLFKK